MTKGKYPILKQKITHKNVMDKSIDRFSLADSVLVEENNNVTKQMVARKTFSLPEEEVAYFNKIKNKALDYRVIISDSEIVRLGLIVLHELDDNKFHEKILGIKKIKSGRPRN